MTPQIDAWTVGARPGGWLRLQEQDGDGARVYLRYRLSGSPAHERLTLTTVVIRGDKEEGISGRVWRRVPLVKVERALAPLTATASGLSSAQSRLVNQVRDAFRAEDRIGDALDRLDTYFESGEQIDELIGKFMHEAPKLTSRTPREQSGESPVVRPPEGRITTEFLESVAAAYRHYSASTEAPAREIADAADVPVRTVHRWVYEARNRGILPKARAGRAG